MAQVHRCAIEVRGYELDSFGHLNHAVYISYLEHARWKMLADAGINLETFKRWSRWPVIGELRAKYRRPTFLGDQLEIRSHVADHSKAAFRIEQQIYRGEELVFSGEVQVVMVDETGRANSLPDEVATLWN